MVVADTGVVIIIKLIIAIRHKNWSVVGYAIKSNRIRKIGTIGSIAVVADGNTIVSWIGIQTYFKWFMVINKNRFSYSDYS